MATIQIRNVPDAVHRAYQARAAAAGMSLQEFLLAELVLSASTRSPAELVAAVAEHQRAEGVDGFSRLSSAEVIRQDRDAH
jgi:plasmid stability protein